jgi:hypothetical protein
MIAAQGVNALRDMHGAESLRLGDHDIDSAATCRSPRTMNWFSGLRRYADVLRAEPDCCRDAVLAIGRMSNCSTAIARSSGRSSCATPTWIHAFSCGGPAAPVARHRAEDDDLLQALLASVSGIAQGLQTTG